MSKYDALLSLAITVAKDALKVAEEIDRKSLDYSYLSNLNREMKSDADLILEKKIISGLLPSSIPILSEEGGGGAVSPLELQWVIDPLDGTVNYMRGLASSGISIALTLMREPIFGVIAEYPTGRVAWGGKQFGAYLDGEKVLTSTVDKRSEAILCTGFPSRYEFTKDTAESAFQVFDAFSKIRMLGSASISLLSVACGLADAYLEKKIMFWDVAAGLALLEGAGGKYQVNFNNTDSSVDVYASNGVISLDEFL